MDDAYELLSEEHRTVEALLQRYATARDGVLVHQIVDALRIHDEIETQVLYPEIRRYVDGGDDLAEPAEAEHVRLRASLTAVTNADSERQPALIDAIARDVAQHVHYEEGTLFPAMRDAGVDAVAMARALVAARGEAPSRSSGEVG